MKETYRSDGAVLAFRDAGTGLPVVFLHPTPLDGEYWRPLTEKLPDVRSIVPDLRGHGGSQLGYLPVGGFARVPEAPVLSMEQLATDVLALLDYLLLPQAIFAGCSIGGYVMLEIWRQAPQRMRGLAFICSKPQPDAEANHAVRAATIAQASRKGCAKLFENMAQSLIGNTARTRRPGIVNELRAHMLLTPEALMAVQAGLAIRPDSVPTAASISVPVLAIAGGEDPGVTLTDIEAFQAAPGGCALHLLPTAGHFAAYEQPQIVSSLLDGWLQQFEE